MSRCCSHETVFEGVSDTYRRVLVAVIGLNFAMFLTEMIAGVKGESLALQADALDFLGDSATYAISLWVIGHSLRTRATAALLKGISLGLLGTWVLGSAIYRVFVLGDPSPIVMGVVGTLALIVNVVSALLLMRYRNGDANVRSVWLCSRNDAIGNVAVLIAAVAVSTTATAWPDLIVAAIMAGLFVNSAIRIIRQSLGELAHVRAGDA